MQHLACEVLGILICKRAVEVGTDDDLDASLLKKVHLAVKGVQKERGAFGREHFKRVGFEGEGDARPFDLFRTVNDLTEDRLMPEVNPVKISEREHGARKLLGIVLYTPDYPHCGGIIAHCNKIVNLGLQGT